MTKPTDEELKRLQNGFLQSPKITAEKEGDKKASDDKKTKK